MNALLKRKSQCYILNLAVEDWISHKLIDVEIVEFSLSSYYWTT